MPFVGNPREHMPKGITYSFQDYCELVDTTDRVIRDAKRGYIDANQTYILTRLGLDGEQ